MWAERQEGKDGVVPARVMRFLWALVLLSVLFGFLIFGIEHELYRLMGNTFEVAVALFCMISCLYAYRTWSERVILLLAAFAFGGYALSTLFWYPYSKIFTTADAFFSIAILGFLGVMLFFTVAFRIEFLKKPITVSSRIAAGGFFLVIALMALAITLMTQGIAGLDPNLALFLFCLLVTARFIDAVLDHGVYRYSLLWSGICLWTFAFTFFGLRDTLFADYGKEIAIPSFTPLTLYGFLSIVGPLIIISFLLILMGIFACLNSPEE